MITPQEFYYTICNQHPYKNWTINPRFYLVYDADMYPDGIDHLLTLDPKER